MVTQDRTAESMRTESRAQQHAPARAYAHEGFPSSIEAARPLRPAPARFGAAGLSAGQRHRIRRTIAGWEEYVDGGPNTGSDRVALGLGWLSLAIGAGEILAADRLARALGLDRDGGGVIRAFGVREIVTGIALLAPGRPAERVPGMWARVAGDALDLTALVRAFRDGQPHNRAVRTALATVAGVAALDLLCAAALTRRSASTRRAELQRASEKVGGWRSDIKGQKSDQSSAGLE